MITEIYNILMNNMSTIDNIDDEYSILYNTTQTQITKELYNVWFRCYSTSHEYEKT